MDKYITLGDALESNFLVWVVVMKVRGKAFPSM